MIRDVPCKFGFRVECDHEGASQLVRRIQANGVVVVGIHCSDCGHWQARPKAGVDVDALPEYHEISYYDTPRWKREEELCVQRQETARLAREAEKEEKNAEWWDRYNAYLETPVWKRKRAKVMERACWICEACLESRAVHVHHTTYEHVGNEPLYELRAVCKACHDALHQKKVA